MTACVLQLWKPSARCSAVCTDSSPRSASATAFKSARWPTENCEHETEKPGTMAGLFCVWKRLPAGAPLVASLAVGDGVEDAIGCGNLAAVAIAQRVLIDKGLAALAGARPQREAGG